MEGFVGRKKELSILESIWSESKHKCCTVYGRRRIGKSELLKRFCRDKKSLYVECLQSSLSDNLHKIKTLLSKLDGKDREEYGFLSDALDDILDICREEKTLIVFDELPYLLDTAEHVASAFQHFLDSINRETDSMVIVCGSSISVMKKETTDYDRPLYGRFQHRMMIGPMPFDECSEFHPEMSDVDKLMLYLTIGGVPKYHLDGTTKTYREYIKKHFIDSTSDLADESEFIISSEFAPRGRYMAIINAISYGATSVKKISDKTGLERMTCSRCIGDLVETGLISEIHPMFNSPKRPIYQISDELLSFSETILKKSKEYPLSDSDTIYDIIEPQIYTHLGLRFEKFCEEYVKSNFNCLEIGKWWGVDGDLETREIDIAAVILEDDRKTCLIGECKFRGRPIGENTAIQLIEDSKLVKTDMKKKYILFSLSGFTENVEDMQENVILVGLKDLIKS